MKTSNISATMSRGSVLNRRLKNLVMFCVLLILVFSLALVYRISTSKASMYPHHRSLPAMGEKISQARHQKLHYSETTLEHFKKDLIFAGLLPRKSKHVRGKSSITSAHKKDLVDFFESLHPTNWEHVADSDDVAFDLKYLLIDSDLESRMSCQKIDSFIMAGNVHQSESKTVVRVHELMGQIEGVLHKRELFIKSLIRGNGTACEVELHNAKICATMEDYRLLREVFLLTILRHPGIIHMKGYCLRGNRVSTTLREKGMIVVTETGIPLTDSILKISSWSQRMSMALQVAKLLLYLENTPLGSLRITKLTLSDFVLVRGALVKLADLDDLELGNKSCTDNSHCNLKGTDMDLKCINKFCSGVTSVLNVYITTKEVLKPILQSPPGPAEAALVDRLDSFNISTKGLVAELFKFFKQNPPKGPVLLEESEAGEKTNSPYHSTGQNSRAETGETREEAYTHNLVTNFARFGQKNFISLYDYPCPGSVEAWRCVFTVTSLAAAAKLCLTDSLCQAFIAFSSHPEAENLMTVVLKNATDTMPAADSKTTLFIKKRPKKILEKDDNRVQQAKVQGQNGVTNLSLEVETCLNQVWHDQASIRNLWEKTLMKHLGHKELREHQWKNVASRQDFRRLAEMIKAQGKGGKFVLSHANSSEANGDMAERIMFISEAGPRAYHQAYAILYQLDRILGLYHTPPCVSKNLSSDDVEYHRNNIVWDETFRSLITPDGTLSGVLVVPPPKDLNAKVLTLEPLRAMTSDITSFDKSSRLQLEYVLLMWLGRMDRLGDTLGYKDHFIHVNADTAFSSLGTDMSGYLYHCQFPSHVYEVLQCFRCHSEGKTIINKVCFLGDEVIKRTHAMFPKEPHISVQSLKEDDLVMAMNSAATSAMYLVDICISNFGRAHVLY